MTPLLDIEAAATRLTVSTKTVERLISRGELAHVRIGRAVRITPDDLDAYIARQRRYTAAPCQPANVVTFGTPDSRSTASSLSELLAREKATLRRSKQKSGPRPRIGA